jgi:hypothetical protein
VEAQQCVKLTGTNSSIGLIILILHVHFWMTARRHQLLEITCTLPTWWLWRSGCTRSHSELGRETLQRQWYFVLRRGRVGRCQVCQSACRIIFSLRNSATTAAWAAKAAFVFQNSGIGVGLNLHFLVDAGWSSPVARQAHNLKAAGSNPAPATSASLPPNWWERRPVRRECCSRLARVPATSTF